MKNTKPILGWTGAIIGLVGAFTIALNLPFSKWAWIVMLVSSLMCIAYNVLINARSMVFMHAGYSITALVGIYACFWR